MERKHAKLGVNTTILPVDIDVADEMSGDTEMRVITFRADDWPTLLQLLGVALEELGRLIEDVENEADKEGA